jgi:protein ImuB
MLWACLRFPNLPFSAAFLDDEAQHAATLPRALYEGPSHRPVLTCVDARATQAGVRSGQTVTAAYATCSRLETRARDPAAEKSQLELLAGWAYAYSGQVSIAAPDSLLLEVGASLRLFGGWVALQRRLRSDLNQLEHAHCLSLAPVAAAARVLARNADGLALTSEARLLDALGQVPLARSGLADAAVHTLRGAGLTHLRQIFVLPRAELGKRIGKDNLLLLDLMRGMAPETLTLYRPPDRFHRRIELDHHVESWLPLQFPLRRLTRELALFLAARDGGVQRFEIVLEHEGSSATRVPVNLLAPQREANALYEFCRGRLERCELMAEVSAIALYADDLPTLRPRHRDLFESEREQALEWPELAERLRARLGDDAIRPLAVAAEHRPEKAHRYATPTKRIERDHRPRPLWLLHKPIPLRPAPQRILAGPERIESGWWEGGDADARRDYYIVHTRNGQRAWAYLPAGATQGWMLHGWFA